MRPLAFAIVAMVASVSVAAGPASAASRLSSRPSHDSVARAGRPLPLPLPGLHFPRHHGGSPFAPGSVVVSQGGTIAATGVSSGTPVKANGDVDVYPPNSNGDVAPEARFTKDMHGPFVVVFDPSGDLWAANVSTSTLVEITKAQLATPNPVPAVTISSASGALDNPYGLAFDRWGNLWVIGNKAGRVYEYAKWQLARSGSPTPVTTISDFPGTPLGDAFDPYGDLWVTIQLSQKCPQGCVVEFSRDELAMANPRPTVTISSTGGANIAFTHSGDMWMVTGGGPLGDR